MSASVPKRCASRWLPRLLLIGLALSQSACYYLQAARGQLALNRAKQPIASLLADPSLPPDLHRQLALTQSALSFAHDELALPDNGSYRSYVDLRRDYIVVNVFAAPALSLQPKRWCYPVVGCMAYRGYFDAVDATEYAEKLSARGFDVATRKVPAYSTLGRFEDPVVNTMLTRSDAGLVSLLFHELAHQLFYVEGDTAFNESFASFVAAEGLRRWRSARRARVPQPAIPPRPATAVLEKLRASVAATRERLEQIYSSELDDAEKKAQKALAFGELKLAWRNAGATSAAPSNNADFLPLSLYGDLTPAFARLLDDCERSLPCLYRRARELGELDAETRTNALARLLPD